jgi:hypothetical protein
MWRELSRAMTTMIVVVPDSLDYQESRYVPVSKPTGLVADRTR